MVPAPQAALFVAEIVAESRQSRQIVAESRQSCQIVAESAVIRRFAVGDVQMSGSTCGSRPGEGRAKDAKDGRRTGDQLA